jgi:Holliday junction resolvase
VLKKMRRNPGELDSLTLYAALGIGKPDERLIDDPARVAEFVAEIHQGVTTALRRPSTLYGWHVQNFFGALVVALDGVKLLKEEDSGSIYSDERVKVPDWSLVLNDGRRILVEVKSIGPKDTTKGLKIGHGEVQGLKNYAALVGGEGYLACYWSEMNLWTLVSLGRLDSDEQSTGSLRVGIEESLKWNEMWLLGDIWLGVVPPLRLVLRSSTGHIRKKGGDVSEVTFKIDDVEVWCGHRQMETAAERNLVMFLLMHSGWEAEEEVILSNDGSRVESIVWTAEPHEFHEEQGFAFAGAMSYFYSSLYRSLTTRSGSLTSLAEEPEVGMLPSIIPDDIDPSRLPLWRMTQHPNEN